MKAPCGHGGRIVPFHDPRLVAFEFRERLPEGGQHHRVVGEVACKVARASPIGGFQERVRRVAGDAGIDPGASLLFFTQRRTTHSVVKGPVRHEGAIETCSNGLDKVTLFAQPVDR